MKVSPLVNAAKHSASRRRGSNEAHSVLLRPSGQALQITLSGHVQGVGFRPFVYRLATEYGLRGYVQNRLGEVRVLACGPLSALLDFQDRLIRTAPPLARPHLVSVKATTVDAPDDFRIIESSHAADARVFVPPDYFMCADCERELNDPSDRRFRYPFINCTQCGPRYTLIERLPYDRPNTSMAGFPLCPECEAEYRDPLDRRFHAEPVSCPACGPRLTLTDADEETPLAADAALQAAIERLCRGAVVAVKGIGGYHLLCDATDAVAVDSLRRRKHRPDKPLAVMFPQGDDELAIVRQHARLQPDEAALLRSAARPIVLVEKRTASNLAANVAPGLGEIGAFLPYSPLHHLLLEGCQRPLVATSGNLSGEPVLTETADAERYLGSAVDAFLHHDRPIVRPADDSVYRRVGRRLRPLRLGRGVAPVEIPLHGVQSKPLLAVGGHMKGTVALSWEDRVVVSPHIGEMDSPRSLAVFEDVAEALQSLYGIRAEGIVCDAHPGYTTHRWARSHELPVTTVWHHHAHASALVGEQPLPGNWLAFTWDGVGLGEDGTLWGGEALFGQPGRWRRVASFRTFRLPGGERAGREPWRSAAALHWALGCDWQCCPDQSSLARRAWERELNCPETSAAGRLFDAAAAIVTGQAEVSFEAQGPMMLESLCRDRRDAVPMPLNCDDTGVWRSDWAPLVAAMADNTQPKRLRAEQFHSTMAHAILQQARRIRETRTVDRVGLCGGVFQNRVLTDETVDLLMADGFQVHIPKRLPCNDAALSFGQAVEIAARQDTRA